MSFGRTPQQADNSFRNVTVTDTLTVRGKMTAGVLDAADALFDTATVNGSVTVGGTLNVLGGVVTPSLSAATGSSVIAVPDVAGTLVLADEATDGLIVPVPLTVGAPGPAVGTVKILIDGVEYKILLAA